MPAKKTRNKFHLPYVSIFQDRHGRLRYRFRRAGRTVMLPDPLQDEAAFEAAYAEALLGVAKKKSRAADGTVGKAVQLRMASSEFHDLKPGSQRAERSRLNLFMELVGEDTPVADFHHRNLKRLLDLEAGSPGRRNNLLRAARTVFDIAIVEDWIKSNPATLVKKSKLGQGAVPWGADQVAAFRNHWPLGSRQRLAFEVYLWTAQRSSDGFAMQRSAVTEPLPFDVGDGEPLMLRRWRMVQQKTDEELEHVLHPDLGEAWDAIEESEGVGDWPLGAYAGSRKRSDAGGNSWFNDAAAAALGRGTAPGGKNWTCHGLRKLGATMISEAGGTDAEIAARGGWRTRAQVVNYTRSAAQRKLGEAALLKVLQNVTLPKEEG